MANSDVSSDSNMLDFNEGIFAREMHVTSLILIMHTVSKEYMYTLVKKNTHV